MSIIPFFVAAFCIRMVSLFISLANERRLKAAGATEYGRRNSALLTLCHILFYAAALAEAIARQRVVNSYTWAGAGLFLTSMFFLWMVIRQLGPVWTVKLYIAPDHQVNRTPLFRYIKHPNYFLNVLPELLAIALLCQAWYVLIIGLPIYLVPLIIRIRQEEQVMKTHFKDY